MKRFVAIIFTLLSSHMVLAQLDSLKAISVLDSASIDEVNNFAQSISTRVDTTIIKVEAATVGLVADTIAFLNNRLSEIQRDVNVRVDSLTHSYTSVLASIQQSAKSYQSKLDSLQSMKLPTEKYQAKMDSLSRQLNKVQYQMASKIEEIKGKAMKRVKELPFPPEFQGKVDQFASSLGNINLKTIEAKLPTSLGLGNVKLLTQPLSLDNLTSGVKIGIPDLPKVKGIDQNGLMSDVKSNIDQVKGLDEVSEVGRRTGEVQGKIDQAGGSLNPSGIDKLAESKAQELKEVKALQEASSNIPLDPTMSEKEMKTKLKEEASKIAVDHFADKQQQLKAAMEKISKYKQKYSSVKSIADISRKPRNEMKDKPFVERIVPGLGIQFQKKGETLMVDFNPYVGYRITNRITVGAGWNERVPYSFDANKYDAEKRIFGPRAFGEFRLRKGFFPRLELEVMNTALPPSPVTAPADPENREWVGGIFLGMKKEYKLVRQVKGTASIMTRLINPGHKSPYADVLNLRMGFELPIKKKRKS